MEPGGLWDADEIEVRASVEHNRLEYDAFRLSFARRNVYEGRFKVPSIEKDYEVLGVRVTASQPQVANFGFHHKTYKLIP